MATADSRSAVRCWSHAGSPMWTHWPSSRWSATSHRPSPRATTWGRSWAATKGHRPRHSRAALRRRSGAARDEHLQLRVEVTAQRCVVGDGDAVAGLGSLRQPHAERLGDGVAHDEEPDGVPAIGPGVLQCGVLRHAEARRQWDRHPRRPPRHPPAPSAPRPRSATPGRAGRVRPPRGRPRRTRLALPIASRPLTSPSTAVPPGRAAETARERPSAARSRLLRVGRSGPLLEHPECLTPAPRTSRRHNSAPAGWPPPDPGRPRRSGHRPGA